MGLLRASKGSTVDTMLIYRGVPRAVFTVSRDNVCVSGLVPDDVFPLLERISDQGAFDPGLMHPHPRTEGAASTLPASKGGDKNVNISVDVK